MNKFDDVLNELDQLVEDEKLIQEQANIERDNAEKIIKDSKETVLASEYRTELIEDARKKTEEAQLKTEEAEQALVKAGLIESEDEEDNNKKTNSGTKSRFIAGFLSGVAATLIVTGSIVLIKKSVTGTVKEDNRSMSSSQTLDDKEDLGAIVIDNVNQKEIEEPKEDLPIVDANDNDDFSLTDVLEDSEYEELTTEKFEDMAASYIKLFEEENISVSKQDIIKFIAIANIDRLVEDNPELAEQLFTVQSKEEYLNDAAKVIGAVVMDGFNKWNATGSVEDFIKVSDIIFGDQKDNMLKIEEYTSKIAAAVNEDDADKVNTLVSEFLTDINNGSLSNMDDGVGFASQIHIALIADGIARSHINQQNFDMIHLRQSAEDVVSNIFRVYDGCNGSYSK